MSWLILFCERRWDGVQGLMSETRRLRERPYSGMVRPQVAEEEVVEPVKLEWLQYQASYFLTVFCAVLNEGVVDSPYEYLREKQCIFDVV